MFPSYVCSTLVFVLGLFSWLGCLPGWEWAFLVSLDHSVLLVLGAKYCVLWSDGSASSSAVLYYVSCVDLFFDFGVYKPVGVRAWFAYCVWWLRTHWWPARLMVGKGKEKNEGALSMWISICIYWICLSAYCTSCLFQDLENNKCLINVLNG